MTTTRGIDIFNLINNIISKFSLDWSKCLSICTDGAAALTGHLNGFKKYALEKNPNLILNHCMIHRTALSTKVLGPYFHDKISFLIEIINSIKQSPKQSNLFAQLCDNNSEKYRTLLSLLLYDGYHVVIC